MECIVRKAKLLLDNLVLREFYYDIIEDEKEEIINAFPFSFYKEQSTYFEMREGFIEACKEGYTIAESEILRLFISPFAKSGCAHHYSNCQLFCEDCEQYYSCTRCHDKPHEIAVARLRCNICGAEEKISNQCVNCKNKFGHYYCKICCIFDLFDEQIKPFTHCTLCKECHIGTKLLHCHYCNQCRPKDHVCNDYEGQICPLCTDPIAENFVKLQCGHFIHKKCKDKMFENNSFNCPMCRRQMLSPNEQVIFNKIMSELYQNEPISHRLLEVHYWYICNQCGKEFVEIFHPIGERCANCKCLSFNTSILQICDERENAPYILQTEEEMLLEQGIQILQNHVNDLEYYENLLPELFKKDLEQELVNTLQLSASEEFQQILLSLNINQLSSDVIIDYLEVLDQNYTHGMTLEEARNIIEQYIEETQKVK